MIEVRYDRKALELTVKGHAQSAEKGKDLVCAAASILVYTLAADVNRLTEGGTDVISRQTINLTEGDAKITCRPVLGKKAVATVIFDSVVAGFDVLAQQYPEYIKFSLAG